MAATGRATSTMNAPETSQERDSQTERLACIQARFFERKMLAVRCGTVMSSDQNDPRSLPVFAISNEQRNVHFRALDRRASGGGFKLHSLRKVKFNQGFNKERAWREAVIRYDTAVLLRVAEMTNIITSAEAACIVEEPLSPECETEALDMMRRKGFLPGAPRTIPDPVMVNKAEALFEKLQAKGPDGKVIYKEAISRAALWLLMMGADWGNIRQITESDLDRVLIAFSFRYYNAEKHTVDRWHTLTMPKYVEFYSHLIKPFKKRAEEDFVKQDLVVKMADLKSLKLLSTIVSAPGTLVVQECEAGFWDNDSAWDSEDPDGSRGMFDDGDSDGDAAE